MHISSYGYTPVMVGISYAIPALLFALTCPFIYLLTDRMRKRGLILIGWLCIVVALLMVGGSSWIEAFYNNDQMIFLGLVVIGLSAGMISIPILPEMLEAIEEDEQLGQKYDRDLIENATSCLLYTSPSPRDKRQSRMPSSA